DEESFPSMLVAARGERAALDALVERLQTGEINIVQVRNGLPGARPKPPGPYGADKAENIAWSLAGASLRANRGMLLGYMNELVEVARLPVEQQQDYLDRLERRQKELPLLARELAQEYISETFKAYQQSRADLRCTAALLAAERFRLAHGHLPESLKELVPGFLDKVPIDPYDRSPLRYRCLENGCVIYAVGRDKQGQGGTLRNNIARPELTASRPGKYIAFQLWDGDRRQR